MGLFDFVDKVIGTDLSGNKARGAIDKAAGAANVANAQAMETLKQYGSQAMELYKQYTQMGLDESTAAQQAAIDAQKAGFAAGRSTYQDLYNQAQQARQPYEQAGVSMMGVLPQLQAALGLAGANGAQYDVAASPLYQWQLQQMDDQLKHQLNAMGISGDSAAAYIRSKNVGQLAAGERERQVANMQQMLSQGLQVGSTLGQPQMQAASDLSSMDINQGLNTANLLNQGASTRAGLYSNLGQNLGQTQMGIGANLAQGGIAQGQNLMNASLSKAQIPNGMNTLLNTGLQLYGMGAFGGGSAATPAVQNLGASTYRNVGQPFMYGLSGIPGLGG